MSSNPLRNLNGTNPAAYGGDGNEYNHNPEDLTIIGIRRGNGWKIQAQVHTRTVKNIGRVEKLFG